MPFSSIGLKAQLSFYRFLTVLKSIKALYTLSPKQINLFLNSYAIYEHDWLNKEELVQRFGVDYWKEIKGRLIDYYSVLNHLCSIGQVEKMYIPPAMNLSASIIMNQALFEKKMAKDLGLQKGEKALDIGCGRGRVAAHMASLTGAHITGMNIDPDQIATAKKFALKNKAAEGRCEFCLADLNAIPYPFANNSFDHIYEVAVFSLSQDLEATFKEINRILKPGGKFACLEWVLLDKYDPNNLHHVALLKKTKPLIGAIGDPSPGKYVDALQKAGFEVLVSENPSVGGYQAPLIEKADQFFNRITKMIESLTKWKLIPAHFKVLFDRLTQDGAALIEADRLGILTMAHYIVAQKK